MLCPFCLKEGTIRREVVDGRIIYICSEHPEPKIPAAYAENQKIQREVISAIGFRGHGKSAYFAALFSILDQLAQYWSGFYYFATDEQSLATVQNNVKLLKGGKLPSATPKNFPLPTIVQFSNMPQFRDQFFIFYDTSGESYESASKLIGNASFIKNSNTAIFFMSLHDLEYSPSEMHRLLQVYIQGLKECGGDPSQQHILVVLTKGDLLRPKLESRPDIWKYLVNGDVKKLKKFDYEDQIREMKKMSRLLKDFLARDIRANQFLNLGNASFKNMDVCLISALGSAPAGDQLELTASPKRIFDPILWVMFNSSGRGDIFYPIKKFFASSKSPTPIKKSSASDTTTTKLTNKGLFYWLAGSLLLLVLCSFLVGMILPQLQNVSSPDIASNSVSLPLVNQTDVASIQKGVSFLNSGNYNDALNEFNTALVGNPQSPTIWNYKGYTLFKLGKNDEAIQAYDQAISLDGDNVLAWNNKGYALTLQKKYDNANSAFDHVLKIESTNKDALMGKGTSLFLNKNYSTAVDVLNQLIVLDPDNIQALTYQGESLQALNRYSDAIKTYDRILELSQNDKQILLNKGDCLNMLADYQNASNVFDHVLENDPQNKGAMIGKGNALLKMGKNQDALNKFDEMLTIDPNSVDALVGKSKALLALKNSYDSLQTANKALELDPNNSEAWICKGEVWAAQSKFNDASQAYDQALKNNPDSLNALMGKADVLIKMEDYAGAVAILEKAITLHPDNKELWNEKGFALMKKGDNAPAEVAFNKAIELDPKYVLAWNYKAYALSGAGNYNQSLQAFNKAIELNPNFKDAWIGKSILYTKMGDFKASEEAANQAMSIKY